MLLDSLIGSNAGWVTPSQRRKGRLGSHGALIGAGVCLAWALAYVVIDAPRYVPMITINASMFVLLVGARWFETTRRFLLARHIVLASTIVYLTLLSILLGHTSGVHHWFYVVLLIAAFVAPSSYSAAVYIVSCIAALVGLTMWGPSGSVFLNILGPRYAELINITLATFAIALLLRAFDRDMVSVEGRLFDEHARSERLLANVLPDAVRARLKRGESTIADAAPEVTVLFADIVGFTELSSRASPEALVEMLSEVFSRFDDLAAKHGLEKIKTIGDAYMAVAGVPVACADHADRAAAMAIDMREALAAISDPHGAALRARIGMHSGAVVAGVIGKRKFAYDLWGDTVNLASRMESHGLPNAIHVSAATAAHLRGRWDLDARGAIAIKGKGEMETFFLKGRRSAS
jgi:class 3 adenylate cyclase